MPIKSLPQPGDSNWGIPLNNYLTQLTDSNKGGAINTFSKFSQRLTNLTIDDKGKTFLFTQTGNLHEWTGSSWIVYDTNGFINVKDYGVIGDGIADETAAIQSIFSNLSNTNILFPIGRYRLSSVMINKNNTTISGAGDSDAGTIFIGTITNGDNLIISNCQHCLIQNIYIVSEIIKQSGFGILVTGCFAHNITNVRLDYGYNGIGIIGSTESRIINCQLRYLFGLFGLYFGGTQFQQSYRLAIDNLITNNPYPIDYGKIISYGPSKSFANGDITVVNNKIWQCTQSGITVGNSSVFQIPIISPSQVFQTQINDGICKFNFVSALMNWIEQDSFAYSLVLSKAALLNGNIGYVMKDSLNTTDSYPKWAFTWDLETDHNYYCGALQDAGEALYINGGWIGSCLSGNGILLKGRGESFVGGGTRIMGHAEHGILINGGTNNKVSDCFIGANSQKNVGTYNGVTVGANQSKFYISNNKIGTLTSGGNSQGNGITINSGCDRYIISNNDISENINGNNLGTASATRIINGNLG